MLKGMPVKTIAIALACVLLGVSNPSKDAYYRWIADKAAEKDGGGTFLKAIYGTLSPFVLDDVTKVHNVGLFTIFVSEIDKGQRFAVLGILNSFIPVPSELAGNLASPVRAWVPGSPMQGHPHVVAASENGKWQPEDGYTWVNPNANESYEVKWTTGSHSTKYARVIAGQEEGKWVPEFGYAWAHPEAKNNYDVIWGSKIVPKVNPMEGIFPAWTQRQAEIAAQQDAQRQSIATDNKDERPFPFKILQYTTPTGWGFDVLYLEISALDDVTVSNVIINRGNCHLFLNKINDQHLIPASYPIQFKFGIKYGFYTELNCSPREVLFEGTQKRYLLNLTD